MHRLNHSSHAFTHGLPLEMRKLITLYKKIGDKMMKYKILLYIHVPKLDFPVVLILIQLDVIGSGKFELAPAKLKLFSGCRRDFNAVQRLSCLRSCDPGLAVCHLKFLNSVTLSRMQNSTAGKPKLEKIKWSIFIFVAILYKS